MRLCELNEKEVINTIDCRKLGNVTDLVFDPQTGQIEALIVPQSGKFWGLFGEESEFVIPFSKIKKIGPDIVLVEMREDRFLHKV